MSKIYIDKYNFICKCNEKSEIQHDILDNILDDIVGFGGVAYHQIECNNCNRRYNVRNVIELEELTNV